jgi:hypothetical protein
VARSSFAFDTHWGRGVIDHLLQGIVVLLDDLLPVILANLLSQRHTANRINVLTCPPQPLNESMCVVIETQFWQQRQTIAIDRLAGTCPKEILNGAAYLYVGKPQEARIRTEIFNISYNMSYSFRKTLLGYQKFVWTLLEALS